MLKLTTDRHEASGGLFATAELLVSLNPFNEMFIVNSKSHCCNDTFTDVQFTSLLAKNI